MKKIPLLIALIFLPLSFIQSQTDNDSLLFEAVKSNNLTVVKSLVDRGANVNAVDKDGGTILMWAAGKADLDMVKYLVKNGADYNKKGVIWLNTRKTFLFYIVSQC